MTDIDRPTDAQLRHALNTPHTSETLTDPAPRKPGYFSMSTSELKEEIARHGVYLSLTEMSKDPEVLKIRARARFIRDAMQAEVEARKAGESVEEQAAKFRARCRDEHKANDASVIARLGLLDELARAQELAQELTVLLDGFDFRGHGHAACAQIRAIAAALHLTRDDVLAITENEVA